MAGSVALDETGPSMDLMASYALWHLYREGLVIPFASEGLRKYSQEYANPWRGVATIEERVGRTLGSTVATLHFPWDAATGEATIVVRVHGASAGKKLSWRLNGKPIRNVKLESGWQQVAMPVAAQVLKKGENTLALAAGKRGAIFHSIEVVPGTANTADQPWPAPSPVSNVQLSGKQVECLTGFPRMRMPVEIPDASSSSPTTAATKEGSYPPHQSEA